MPKYLIKMIYYFFTTIFIMQPAAAQQYTNSTYKDLFLASLSYHAVARVCGDTTSIEISKQNLRRVVNFGEYKNLLSAEAIYYLKYPEETIQRAENQFRKDRYVGCSQAREIINQLNEATKKLP